MAWPADTNVVNNCRLLYPGVPWDTVDLILNIATRFKAPRIRAFPTDIFEKTYLTMRSTELRLGNVVAPIDEPVKPDHVIILEPGTVHLMNRAEGDDELNIVPVNATPEMLAAFEIPTDTTFSFSGRQVRIESFADGVKLHVDGACFPFSHVHELQNLLMATCGDDIIRHPQIHTEPETL